MTSLTPQSSLPCIRHHERTDPTCMICAGEETIGHYGSWTIESHGVLDVAHVYARRMRFIVHTVMDAIVFLSSIMIAAGIVWSIRGASSATIPSLIDASQGFWLLILLTAYGGYRMTIESTSHKLPSSLGSAPQTLVVEDFCSNEVLRVIDRAFLRVAMIGSGVAEADILTELLGLEHVQFCLMRLGVSPDRFKERLQTLQRSGSIPPTDLTVWRQRIEHLLIASSTIALRYEHHHVDAYALVYAVSQHPSIQELLVDNGHTDQDLRDVIRWVGIEGRLRRRWFHFRHQSRWKPRTHMDRAMTALQSPFLDMVSTNMTARAARGAYPLVVGRSKEFAEIDRLLNAGMRGILLVGVAGVGKSAIIEGMAERMASEDVPLLLKDKRLMYVSVGSLIGSGASGSPEQHVTQLFYEAQRAGNVVLAIDHLHQLAGISGTGGSSLDLLELVSSYCQKTGIIVLATTTPSDYRRWIEPKTSFLTVFERVMIEEMNDEQSLEVVESRVGHWEVEHHVFFTINALKRVVELSRSVLPDRRMPEKAIMITEEVATAYHGERGKPRLIIPSYVEKLIQDKTGIPVAKAQGQESDLLLHFEQRIHEHVVDQEEAVSAVANALRRARSDLGDRKRPIVSLLFLGPTGVGKTEVARTVANLYFTNNTRTSETLHEAVIRVDMSEYQHEESVDRFLGVPGGATGGVVTEAIRTNPFALLLLDEVEKAHPKILTLFLQILDEGHVTDVTGRTIDCTNLMIIGTSNAGTSFIQEGIKEGKSIKTIQDELFQTYLSQYFPPELLNRFDGIVVFKPLSPQDVVAITRLLLNKTAQRLDKQGVGFRASEEGVQWIAQRGYDPQYGARPLRRVIQNDIDNKLAELLLANQLNRRDVVVLNANGSLAVEPAT